MNQSETITDLATALIEAKKKFLPALKTAVNPAFKSKYTDLATAIAATETALLEYGLVLLQSPHSDIPNHTVAVTTRLMHKSGQFMEGSLEMPAIGRNGFDAQSMGSAITYARRYALMAFLGIAPEDDDGNAASGAGTTNRSGKEIVRRSEKAQPAQIGITSDGEPIWDEDGSVVTLETPLAQQLKASIAQRQAAPPATNGGFKTITEKQAKRFFAVSMSAGHSKAEINNYLGSLGYEKTEEIEPAKYEEAMQWAATR